MQDSVNQLTDRLSPLIRTIINHPLYGQISSLDHLRIFMEQHVFAVWDFMCLLKELHSRLVSTSAPWFPPKDALSANLISSILVEEEGDITEDGVTYASHYDMYITAMEKIHANTGLIKELLLSLRQGELLESILNRLTICEGTKNFVLTTFSFFKRPVHEIAAAFVYGREGITSAMFMPMLERLEAQTGLQQQSDLTTLIYYFKRHIDLDDNEHFPKALKMLANLIGNDAKKLAEVESAAVKALTARINFLSDIQASLGA